MKRIDQLFDMHNEAVAISAPVGRARFGIDWKQENGIILYPGNSFAGFTVVLLQRTLPGIKLAVCSPNPSAGVMCNGLPVMSVAEASRQLPDALIAICAPGDTAAQMYAEVVPKLPAARSNNIITFRQLGEFLPVGDKKSKCFDMYRKAYLAASPRNRKKVEDAFGLFTDSLSQAVFLSVLRRYLLSSDALVPISDSIEYFDECYTLLPDEVVVDCGAFSGDTLLQYLQLATANSFQKYIAYEPDPANFQILNNTVAGLPETVRDKIVLHPHALGHEEATVYFDALGNGGSVVNPDGTTAVRCVTLDQSLEGIRPTLMKFDIEGYEAFALQGAKATITEARPVLALCVYHHPFDLWELPLQVQRMVPDYRFFLRAYDEQFDYICYAVPPERVRM